MNKRVWQCEIVANDDLLDEDGNLKHPGYARKLFLKYDRRRIAVSPKRIKEWDYYLIYNRSFALALTIADNGYMGMFSVSVINLIEPKEKTKSKIIWFPMGKLNLPASSIKGDVIYKDRQIEISFKILDNCRKIYYKFANFASGKDLVADITLTHEPKESMVIATPFKEPKHFYYNQKIVGFIASGKVVLGEDIIIDFSGENSRAILDWGRGVWPYKNTWFWGAGASNVAGHEVGFNIGYGFGNNSFATENMVFFDGFSHKIEHVNIEFAKNKNKTDYLLPAKITSSDGRFEMDFLPIIDRHSNTDIGVIGSNQHQVFGLFYGTMVLDDGQVITISEFPGFVEEVKNKW